MSLLNEDIQQFELDTKIKIFKELKEIAYDIKIDELNCSKSFQRQPLDISFEEALTRMTDLHHFTIIRRQYTTEDHIEASLSSLNAYEADTFIWLKIKIDNIEEIKQIILKYKDKENK